MAENVSPWLTTVFTSYCPGLRDSALFKPIGVGFRSENQLCQILIGFHSIFFVNFLFSRGSVRRTRLTLTQTTGPSELPTHYPRPVHDNPSSNLITTLPLHCTFCYFHLFPSSSILGCFYVP